MIQRAQQQEVPQAGEIGHGNEKHGERVISGGVEKLLACLILNAREERLVEIE